MYIFDVALSRNKELVEDIYQLNNQHFINLQHIIFMYLFPFSN